MLKMMFVFLILTTLGFSKDILEFEIQKSDTKKIEVILKNKQETKVYIIKSGDTLSELALKLKNNMDSLIELNEIKNKDLIITGEKLKYKQKVNVNEI